MKRIVECLLEEGILEEDIHRILDLIEEEYEIVSEVSDETVKSLLTGREANFKASGNRSDAIKLDAAKLAADLRNSRKSGSEMPGETKEEKNFYNAKREAIKANNVVLRGQAKREENKEQGIQSPESLKKHITTSTKKANTSRKKLYNALDKIPGSDYPTKYRKYMMNQDNDEK